MSRMPGVAAAIAVVLMALFARRQPAAPTKSPRFWYGRVRFNLIRVDTQREVMETYTDGEWRRLVAATPCEEETMPPDG